MLCRTDSFRQFLSMPLVQNVGLALCTKNGLISWPYLDIVRSLQLRGGQIVSVGL